MVFIKEHTLDKWQRRSVYVPQKHLAGRSLNLASTAGLILCHGAIDKHQHCTMRSRAVYADVHMTWSL